MRQRIIGLTVLVAALASFLGKAPANVVVYTDRSTWEAAAGSIITENFNSLPEGTLVTPATAFPSSITITPATAGETDISDFAFGNIGEGTALRTFDDYTVAFPVAVVSIGFDYADLDWAGATISFGNFSQALPLTGDADTGVTPDDFAFFGAIVGNPSEIGGSHSIIITGFEGFSVDNLSFSAVAEPSTFVLLGVGAIVLVGHAWRRRYISRMHV